MSAGEQQNNPSPSAIREEVRRTIQQLNEMASTEKDFDQFCDTVLSKVVKITGAHGALLWQVNGENTPKLTHQTGRHPNATAKEVLSHENRQHNNAVMEVVTKQLPMGLTSEAFTGRGGDVTDPNAQRDDSFLMLFSPVYNRTKECCGTLELLQRGDISPQAQEGYLRFLTQVSQLFQRWHEQQDLAKLSEKSDAWNERIEFISEAHRSIDVTETAYSIANEARRLLNCDRVSVGKWNGRTCKINAISSQDRFDNRANVVRLLSNVATASVAADSRFWITGNTDGLAPEVARKINEYLDESHSRTLIVIPLLARPPETADLEMKSRRNSKTKKLGAIVIEYFDADVAEATIEEDTKLIVSQSEIAMENSRKHGEIFMLPIWKRLGWLQKLLFRDHFAKTMTGLACLALLTLAMFFWPKELKMKVEGVMHPEIRNTIYAQTKGTVQEILIEERAEVVAGQPLLRLENQDLDIQLRSSEYDLDKIDDDISRAQSQLRTGVNDTSDSADIGMAIKSYQKQRKVLESQIELMKLKKSRLEISSPIDGIITTPELKRRYTDYPVEPSFALLEVANLDGDWQLELKIPQGKMGYVDSAFIEKDTDVLDVEFKIGTNPNLNLKGKLSRKSVDMRAVPSESGAPDFRAIVQITPEQRDELNDELRSGATATAKILCGKKPLGQVCFYQAWDFLRTTIFF
jgi:multidrug efflux pump subunit AcrA (membrane-fusion protein)